MRDPRLWDVLSSSTLPLVESRYFGLTLAGIPCGQWLRVHRTRRIPRVAVRIQGAPNPSPSDDTIRSHVSARSDAAIGPCSSCDGSRSTPFGSHPLNSSSPQWLTFRMVAPSAAVHPCSFSRVFGGRWSRSNRSDPPPIGLMSPRDIFSFPHASPRRIGHQPGRSVYFRSFDSSPEDVCTCGFFIYSRSTARTADPPTRRPDESSVIPHPESTCCPGIPSDWKTIHDIESRRGRRPDNGSGVRNRTRTARCCGT